LPFSPLASQARVCRLPGGTIVYPSAWPRRGTRISYRASALTAYGFFI
jgi:hypothetical protein